MLKKSGIVEATSPDPIQFYNWINSQKYRMNAIKDALNAQLLYLDV